MKTKVFFIAVIIFSLASSASPAVNTPDTCQILSVDSILPYSQIEVEVRVFSDQALGSFAISLTFYDSTISGIRCDSIHWSDWFWNTTPAPFAYAGEPGIDYIKEDSSKLNIWALWVPPNGLPPKDTTLATIHFSIGEISLIEPNGGETWCVDDSQWVKWSAQMNWDVNDSILIDSLFWEDIGQIPKAVDFYDSCGVPVAVEFVPGYLKRAPLDLDSVAIEYSLDAGKTWNTIISSTPNDSEYLWSPIPDTLSDSCLIRISSRGESSISGISKSFFSIVRDLALLVQPNGGEVLNVGDSATILWDAACTDNVKLEYSADAGLNWHLIDILQNTGEYLWQQIPDTPSDSCLFKISSHPSGSPYDISDGFFTIFATEVKEEKKEESLPATFVLYQNYPNPFNPSTKIEFSLPHGAQVQLDVYNVSGKRVKRLIDKQLASGHWSILWNGEDNKGIEVASGVYFYRLKTSQYTQTRKMVIIR